MAKPSPGDPAGIFGAAGVAEDYARFLGCEDGDEARGSDPRGAIFFNFLSTCWQRRKTKRVARLCRSRLFQVNTLTELNLQNFANWAPSRRQVVTGVVAGHLRSPLPDGWQEQVDEKGRLSAA